MSEAINLHNAYVKGDLEAVKKALGNPPDFPNCCGLQGVGEICLEYAIYHSPISFIRMLLEQGADSNYPDHCGFPLLIAALSTSRDDKYEIVELLLSNGADIGQRGVNNYPPLHYAANSDDPRAIELLVVHGADIEARRLLMTMLLPWKRLSI